MTYRKVIGEKMANLWIGTIRLTKDPEVKYSQDGKAFARFSGACNRTFKKEGQPDADFFEFSAFGKLAETIEKCVHKGTKLLIEAEVRNNNWTDDKGVKHYGTQFVVNSIEFCEKKSDASATPAPAPTDSDGFMNIPDSIGEELPFN